MSNPFSGSEIPGMNAMGDTLSFVKNLWGSMQVPGMVAPPMSVDELDKKIQDLKTVESWLTVNMNMLRGTIQALEVQRATLAALQSLGESFAHHAQQASAMAEQASAFSAASTDGKETSNANWPMHPAAAKADATVTAGATNTAPEPDPDDEVDEDEDMPPDDKVVKPAPSDELPPEVEQKNAMDGAPGDTNAQFVNPAAWWGLLQEQFKQAVSKAMESEQVNTATEEPAPARKAATKRRASTTNTPSATVTPAARTVKPGATEKAKPVTASKKTAGTSKAPVQTAGKTLAKTAAKTTVKTTEKTAKTTKTR